jgi:glycosyltransferase involved in cell wall biosynthesis
MKVSIIAPAHNEEERIRPFLDTYCAYFDVHHDPAVEIIVVVNNSTDRTRLIVQEYADKYDFVRLLLEPNDVGKGGALLRGFDVVDGELIGFVDADGATAPDAFMELADQIGDAGVIIASRWMEGAEVSPRQPVSRRVASRIFNTLVRVFFGLRISDTQCGAKLMRRDALRVIRPHIGTTRWAFDVDLLFQFRRKGYRIKEVPTRWHDVTGSKVRVARASFEMLIAMTRLRLLYSPFRFVVKLYDISLGRFINPAKIEIKPD